jgi:D-alanyl-D-alanine carboxypeptidase (penicillin-binding protein 5/6)
VPVSEHAWRTGGAASGGSTMFLPLNSQVKVDDLLHGIIIQSGNDASIALAEYIAGTEDGFADMMNETAERLGMKNSHFMNATGLPNPEHYSSARDMAILARAIINEDAAHYAIYSQKEFYWNNIKQGNRNLLLWRDKTVDGLKTGHTEEAGYGLVGSVKQGDRRIIFAISGLTSEAERAEEAERIATWAFRQFALKTVAKAGTRVAEAQVFMGAVETVGLVPAEDIRLLIPALAQEGLQAEVVYTGPLTAPVIKGTPLGELVITVPGLPEHRVALVAEADVAKGGFMVRLTTALRVLQAEYFGTEAPAS